MCPLPGAGYHADMRGANLHTPAGPALTDTLAPAVRPQAKQVGEWARLMLSRSLVKDSLIALALATLALIGGIAHLQVEVLDAAEEETGLLALDTVGFGLVLVQTLPLAARRKTPLLTLAVTLGGLVIFSRLQYAPSLASFGFLIALYTVAAYRDRRISVPAGIASSIAVLMILLLGSEKLAPDTIGADYLIAAAAWFIGDSVRIRRAYVERLEDRAIRLERERAERVRQAVAQERQDIARELHDIVAHNVSVMVAQAGAAQRVFTAQPDDALGALGTIENSGRAALVEMRRLTGFLRTEHQREDARSPQPGLDNLETLVTQVGEAGVPTTLTIEGTRRALPVGLDLSAFRIVQEALTNVIKHAGAARAEVVVRYEPSRLDLRITDDGDGPPHPNGNGSRPGYGQLGMRERVALFGGELHVGRRQGRGYEVSASLPLDLGTV